MEGYTLYWGDLHTHLTDLGRGDEILRAARENIDFAAVLCYPFLWERKKGLRVETVGRRPEFLKWWQALGELSRRHHEPRAFVTFLGYEWHGNRTRWGDHNVIYYDEGNPLDDAPELPELYAHLRTRRAFAIPHHTGYQPGWRGRDWDVYDADISPVMELYSIHGSSEGDAAPLPMASNTSMGPRTGGGTYQDALARGHRIGVIASNDYQGLPGRWGIGRAAVWAEACTREALWEAVRARRTYAVTGDRIALDVRVGGAPMGSVVRADGRVDVDVTVVGSGAIDRIELVHNGRVARTYCHRGTWERSAAGARRWKVRFEAGWGPAAAYGFTPEDLHWDCRLDVDGGRLGSVERCFSLLGQGVHAQDARHCAWHLTTAARVERSPFGMTQGLVLEIEGDLGARLRFDVDGQALEYRLSELAGGAHLVPFVDESRQRVEQVFGLREEHLGNPDVYFHNARKVLLHRAIPEVGYRVNRAFEGVELDPGRNYLYVRVTQCNGQMGWSSPVWVEEGNSG